MIISPDGRIEGGWGADYDTSSAPRMHYSVLTGKFKGNIDPSKIYEDEDGEDLSNVYFIAKGKVVMLVTDFESGKVYRQNSLIYVTGWLDQGYYATGRVTITADKNEAQTFEWESGASALPPVLSLIE